MPQIGEIKQGKEIGITRSSDYYRRHIYSACIDCGKERWVPIIKGKPRYLRCKDCGFTYVSNLNKLSNLGKLGAKSHNWKGGSYKTPAGYVLIKIYEDDFFFPMAIRNKTKRSGYVLEHRLVVAKALGRCLHSWEIVHHKGIRFKGIKNKSDNLEDNLQLVSDDRHKQITILENRINILEKRVTLLETENILLKTELQQGRGMRRPPSRYTRGGEV